MEQDSCNNTTNLGSIENWCQKRLSLLIESNPLKWPACFNTRESKTDHFQIQQLPRGQRLEKHTPTEAALPSQDTNICALPHFVLAEAGQKTLKYIRSIDDRNPIFHTWLDQYCSCKLWLTVAEMLPLKSSGLYQCRIKSSVGNWFLRNR